MICEKWAGESAEIKRLEQLYFPERSEVRQQAEREAQEEMKKDLDARMNASLSLLREQRPDIFGQDSPAGRFRAALEEKAARLKSSS